MSDLTAKTHDQLRNEAKALFLSLPPAALRSGSRLARWERQADELTTADGEAGRGVYFFFAGDSGMSRYYAARPGEGRLAEVALSDASLIIDLAHPKVVTAVCRWLTDYSTVMGTPCRWTRSSFQRSFWGLTTLVDVMREALPKSIAGYVVPHVVPGCTPSRQVIIIRDEALRAA